MADPLRTFDVQPVGADEARGIVLMVAFTVVTVLAADTGAEQLAAGALMVLAEVGLLVGRHAPDRLRVLGLAVAAATGLAAIAVSPAGAAEVPVLIAAARLPLLLTDRQRLPVITVLAIAFGGTLALSTGSIAALLAAAGVPLLAQRTVQQRDLTTERDRAVALLAEVEASRDAQAASAATEERAMIAREMHDVLAHSLSGLSLQLQAARAVAVKEGASPAVTAPLQKAAELARDGIAEARAAVGVLGARRARGIAELEHLLAATEATLTVRGRPQVLPEPADHAVYRAVQEGLTNANRHAPGAAIAIALDWAADHLDVTVTNGKATQPPAAAQGNGMGLAGMRARLNAVGGSVEAGPYESGRHGAGWRVQIRVPAGVPAT